MPLTPPFILQFPPVSFQTIEVDGMRIFYREAGAADAPVILLLHGFPTSSRMFRELMPRLASRYRLIAPDLPGFGFTEVPKDRNYSYTFDNLTQAIQLFVEALKLTRYAMYVFDYGAPIGFRLALVHPERILAIISQNGNAYEEGLGDAWDPIRRYWKDPTIENRDALRDFLGMEGTRYQYIQGVKDQMMIAPESYTLDAALLQRPGNQDIQLDLFLDYAENIKLYPAFQAYFQKYQPPLLAIWGKNDPFFIPQGAEAFRRDNSNAEVELLDTGHFAIETHVEEIAAGIDRFLRKIDSQTLK